MAKSLTLEQIIDAAERLVDAEGLDALSMRRLAAELHVAHSGLYSYKVDRQALLVTLLERRMVQIRSELDACRVLPPRERLEALAATLLELYRTSRVSRQISAALLDDGVLAAGATGSYIIDSLESMIDRACIEVGGDDGAREVRALFDAISRAPLVTGPAGPRSDPLDAASKSLLLAGLSAGLRASSPIAA